jgi:predicted metal-dependent hydrolase
MKYQKHLSNKTLLPFKGRTLQLMVTTSLCKPCIRTTAECLLVNLYQEQVTTQPLVENILLQWYKTQSFIYLKSRTAFWADRIGVSFRRICIKDQRSRWGSCSSLHNLNYNWRIIMAPEPVIDYLIIHEVSHLVHFNHSTHFWELVSMHDPIYQEHKLWLKQNGSQLFQIFPHN